MSKAPGGQTTVILRSELKSRNPKFCWGFKNSFFRPLKLKKKKSFTLPNFQINHPLEGIASANGISGEMVKLPFRDIASYSELSSKPAS